VDGSALESCRPIEWTGAHAVDETFMTGLFNRIHAAAFREPELLSLFGISRASLTRLLADARNILAREKTLEFARIPQSGQLHVLGDLHGDVFSLFSALRITGMPSDDNIIVIAGDLVDRGPWGTEVLILVFALKIWKPKSVYIIRGNHETSGCVTRYGFESEVVRKYDLKTHRAFMITLRELPLAIVVQSDLPLAIDFAESSTAGRRGKRDKEQRRSRPARSARGASSKVHDILEDWERKPSPGTRRILVCHGGLWRKCITRDRSQMTIGSLRDLASEHRQIDDPEDSIAEDVLWSDPAGKESPGVCANTLRGAGIFYGAGAVDAFFKHEHLCGLIRGHEGPDMRETRVGMNSMINGYSVDMDLASGFVATVFSAADYPMDAGRGNKGSVATIHGRAKAEGIAPLPVFTTFESERPVPLYLFYKTSEIGDRPSTPRSSKTDVQDQSNY
jgi:serine/threonine-protein phosphatase 5